MANIRLPETYNKFNDEDSFARCSLVFAGLVYLLINMGVTRIVYNRFCALKIFYRRIYPWDPISQTGVAAMIVASVICVLFSFLKIFLKFLSKLSLINFFSTLSYFIGDMLTFSECVTLFIFRYICYFFLFLLIWNSLLRQSLLGPLRSFIRESKSHSAKSITTG